MSNCRVLTVLAVVLDHAFAAHHTSFAHLAATTDSVTGVNADGSTEAISPADFPASLANGVVGITNAGGATWLLTGTTSGNQALTSSCLDVDGSTVMAEVPIAPSRVNLRCLSSGPGGVYAFNQRSNNIGTIDVATGVWSPIARLPGPYDSLILAGDDDGKVQYINGAGERYENNGTAMILVATGFPTPRLAQCGEFDEPNHINSASINGPTRGIQRTNIINKNVKRMDTVPGIIASDVTTGGFQMCPTPSPTAAPTGKGKKGKKGAKGSKGAKKATPSPTMAPTPSPSSSPSATPSSIPSATPSASATASASQGGTAGATGFGSASVSSGSVSVTIGTS